MPAPTKDDVSVDELEKMYDAPAIGDSERNTLPKTQQPITPSEEANPGSEQAEESPDDPGAGDDDPEDSEPGDSGSGDGGKPTGKKKWRERAKEWNEKRKQKRAMRKATKKLAKEGAKKALEQGVKRGADAVAPGSGEAAVRGGKIAFALLRAGVTGNYSRGFSDISQQLKGPVKLIFIAVIVALALLLVAVIMIAVIISMIFGDEETVSRMVHRNTSNTLTVTLAGPDSGAVNAELTYIITAKSTNTNTTNIKIIDKLPPFTHYVSSRYEGTCLVANECNGFYDASTNTVSWNTNETPIPTEARYTLILQLDGGINNKKIANFVTATSEESTASASADTSE